jgi:pantothenate kinase
MERTTWPGTGVDGLLDRALGLLDRPGRAVLGIAGAPASGKSTLAALLLAALEQQRPGAAVGVGMDAFHIGHRVLVRRGQTAIKGAPETFDAVGYLHLLGRIRSETGTVYAPEFDRDIEDSLAHVIEIPPEVGLVVTEGNYLLLDLPPWDGVRAMLDEAWFVHLDDAERRRRMVARHLRHGHDQADAEARTFGSDERNARLVNAVPNSPDLWIEQVPGGQLESGHAGFTD